MVFVARAIILVGPSGSGKSVVAKRVAEATGFTLYDTDREVLDRTDFDHISEIFETHSEQYFRRLEREVIDEIETSSEDLIVATGGGLPAIPGAIERLENAGVTVYLRASVETLWQRLSADPQELADRPLLRDRGMEALEELMNRREEFYSRSMVRLDTDRMSVDEVTRAIVSEAAKT